MEWRIWPNTKTKYVFLFIVIKNGICTTVKLSFITKKRFMCADLNESVYNVWKKLRMVENPLKSQYGLLQRKDVTFWGSISRIRGVNITIISATFFLLLLQKMSSKDSLICYVQQLVFKSTTFVCFSKDKLGYRKAGSLQHNKE